MPPREGSLEPPLRHPIDWRDASYTDPTAVEAELRRVFDICHGCRRCFNLCDSFPRLFDLIDKAPTGELDSVASEDFGPVAEACTLCDMCFMTKCPYVPPHEFNLDFPHLMLRARATAAKQGGASWMAKQLTATDRNGKLASLAPAVVNWASRRGNALTRPALEAIAGIDRDAALPKFHSRTFVSEAAEPLAPNVRAPGYGRQALLFATCFVNYNDPAIGRAARAVLAHNGVAVEASYPGCCGMPQLEQGNIARVADSAARVAKVLRPALDAGLAVIAPIPSCALMLKFEWPLILPDNDDVRGLAKATRDLPQYLMELAKSPGLAPGLKPLPGGVTMQLACHARAQNMGAKAAELLRLIPEIELTVIERCSGHGGAWGVLKDNFSTALKIGQPVAAKAASETRKYLVSECPLAAEHIRQGIERLDAAKMPARSWHPIELMALSYGLIEEGA
ncbi:MAG: glycerol-3-phosphate dehydrogenase [Alphaproteobacteria bacterium]|nr:glycerol-3-phosphate dehydrogenase [Alphaproteobacteria bacterium]